jgi:hypothetical protein
MRAVAVTERVPAVAHKAEHETHNERDGDDEVKQSRLVGAQMQPVLEKKRHRHVDQTQMRRREIREKEERADEKIGLPARAAHQFRRNHRTFVDVRRMVHG